RNWLCLTYMFVMLVPFLATAFFVVYLQNWYEEKEKKAVAKNGTSMTNI
ncbi:MAG TPA: hypothetical protein GX525_08185, partial [Bacilli bacterium]|nr:hypothetical protein [Bacilli bacterium]